MTMEKFDGELVEKLELSFYDNSELRIESCNKMANLALSVIAPYYEKQISILEDSLNAFKLLHEQATERADNAEKLAEELKAQLEACRDRQRDYHTLSEDEKYLDSMKSWIDHHNKMADAAEKLAEELKAQIKDSK